MKLPKFPLINRSEAIINGVSFAFEDTKVYLDKDLKFEVI